MAVKPPNLQSKASAILLNGFRAGSAKSVALGELFGIQPVGLNTSSEASASSPKIKTRSYSQVEFGRVTFASAGATPERAVAPKSAVAEPTRGRLGTAKLGAKEVVASKPSRLKRTSRKKFKISALKQA